VAEHFHGKEGVASSILALGSRINTNVKGKSMKKLSRSTKDRKITGFCGGLAEYFDADVTVIRLVVLAVIVLSGVLPGTVFYFIASLITPNEGA
jgi:phage shock protein C